MVFNSLGFLIFFPIVVLIYYIVPKKAQRFWLLAASYYFYFSFNAKYVLLLIAATLISYLCALAVDGVDQKSTDEAHRKRLKTVILSVGLISNIGILFFFKYINFATDLLVRIASGLHIRLNIPAFDIILPVGISFYTFQVLSYLIDVYRGEIRAERDFIKYALFVSFFPKLVTGPIERAKNIKDQLAIPKPFNFENLRDGFLLMLWGFFLKIVTADRIAVFVNTVYDNHSSYPGMYILTATLLYAFQIYCDFAGYSVIAMGASKILGIDIMDNFNASYLSVSVSEFWRRWHISLTSWFKDYLYIPLGGNRKGKRRKYLNILIVFLVSGLWHGADLSFVAWGFLNGLYQVIGEILLPIRNKAVRFLKMDKDSIGYKLSRMFGTFLLVDFAWIFFRATSIGQAMEIIKSMFATKNYWVLFDGSLFGCGLDRKNFNFMLICLVVLIIADFLKYKGIKIREYIEKQDFLFRCIFIAFSIIFILIMGRYGSVYDSTGFIYSQF